MQVGQSIHLSFLEGVWPTLDLNDKLTPEFRRWIRYSLVMLESGPGFQTSQRVKKLEAASGQVVGPVAACLGYSVGAALVFSLK